MANRIILKKSSVTTKVPQTTDLEYGELALNYADEKLYFKNSNNVIKSFSTTGVSLETLTIGSGLIGTSYNGANPVTIEHADTSSVSNLSSDNSGNTFIQDISLTFDTFGHVTGATVATGTVSVGDGTLTLATSGIATGSQTFTANQATNSTFTVNVPGTDLSYTTAASTGTVVSSTGTNATLPAATTSLAGLMTSADKTKLDGIAAGATANTGTVTSVSGTGTVSGLTLTGTVTTSGNLTLGGTLSVTPSNFSSQTANTFLAAPNGTAGTPTFRTIVAADVPTLNQNTTGSAATLTTGRTIGMTGDVTWTSASFNGSANVTGTSTLANSGVTAGSYGSSTQIPVLTIDAKGRVTAASTSSITVGDGTLTLATSGIATGSQTFTANQGTNVTFTVNVPGTNIAEGTRTTTTVPITSSTGTGATLSAATTSLAGVMSSADKTKLDGIATGATANTGTVTSVGGTGTVSGLTLSGTVTTSGNLTLGGTLSVLPSNFASQTANTFLAAPNGTSGTPTFRTLVAADVPTLNQNTTGTAANVTGTVAVANGGTGATTAANARTNLGATTLGSNIFIITNPSAITFPRFNADNTVSALTAADFRTAIGAGTSSTTGTVTSIATNNGLTGGTITTTGTIGLTGQALALHNLATNGIISRTGTGTVATRTITAGTGITVSNGDGVSGNPTITNSAPDQVVSLTGSGATSVSGTYPNFTISSTDTNTTYSLATSTVAGLVELFSDTVQSVAANAVTATASRTYGIQLNSAGQAVVNVPWSDTNTTYSAGNGISLSGTTFSVAAGTGLTQDASGLSLTAITAGNATVGAVRYNSTTSTAGQFYGGTTAPSGNTRLNYAGDFYATRFFGDGSQLTNLPAASIPTNSNLQINSLGVGTTASGTAGQIRATNQITSFFSDERLKENIRPIENALGKLKEIKGVTYNLNNVAEQYGYGDNKEHVGVIAQDVEKVLPQIVLPAPFDIVVEDGIEVSKSGFDYKTVQYEKLVPLLIQAIKEQQVMIEELQKKIG